MRLVDVLYAFPFLVLAIAIVPILEPIPVLGGGFWTVVLALAVTGWIGYARLLRGEVLSVREREYVTAARALGVPDRTVIRRHVVPNAVAPVVVQATLNVGTVVLTAAALGFLGLGLEPGSAEGVRCSPRAGVRSYRAAGTSPSFPGSRSSCSCWRSTSSVTGSTTRWTPTGT